MRKILELLKKNRNYYGYSAREVSKKLKDKGFEYSHTALIKFENGRNKEINPILLKKLSEIYNLSVQKVFKLAGLEELLIVETESVKTGRIEEVVIKEMEKTIDKLEEVLMECFLTEEERGVIVKIIRENEDTIEEIKNGEAIIKKEIIKELEE